MRFSIVMSLMIFTLLPQFSNAQKPIITKEEKRKVRLDHTVLVQGNIATNPSMELGYSFLKVKERTYCGFSFSSEHFLGYEEEYKMCFKPRAFFTAMILQVGVAVPYVFDFDGNREVYFKPEVGLSLGWAHIVYSNNIPFASHHPFTSQEIVPLPLHNVGIGINFLWGS